MTRKKCASFTHPPFFARILGSEEDEEEVEEEEDELKSRAEVVVRQGTVQ